MAAVVEPYLVRSYHRKIKKIRKSNTLGVASQWWTLGCLSQYLRKVNREGLKSFFGRESGVKFKGAGEEAKSGKIEQGL